MATLSDASKPNLYGWGTYLDTNFDNGPGAQDFLARLQQYDPTAHIEQTTNGDGTPTGSRIAYDGQNPIFKTFTNGFEMNPVQTYGNSTGQAPRANLYYPGAIKNTGDVFGKVTPMANLNQQDKGADVGFWGPLVMAAITAGAGAGAFGGFGGMTDAAAQGLVSGATGSGLAPGAGSFLGLGGSKLPNTFMGLGRQATSGNATGGSLLSSLLPLAGGALGLPSYATSLGRLALSTLNSTGGGK